MAFVQGDLRSGVIFKGVVHSLPGSLRAHVWNPPPCSWNLKPNVAPDQRQTVGLLSFAAAVGLSIAFGTAQWIMGTRHDHPRIRDGRGYTKVGPIPITHHIPEVVAFVSIGWALNSAFILERSWLPSAQLPDWLVIVIVAIFVPYMLWMAPRLQEHFDLPDEPEWHIWLVLAALAMSLLVGFFSPLPQF